MVNGKNCHQCFTKSAYHENQQVFDVDPSQYVLCLMQGNNLSLPKYRQKAPVNYLPPATVDHVIHALVPLQVYFVRQLIGNRFNLFQ